MTRRTLLTAGAGLAIARAACATTVPPTIYPWGRMYTLEGGSNPTIAVLGEPPATPRPTLIIHYANMQQSLTPYNEDVASTKLAALMQTQGWTVCGCSAPGHTGSDRWPDEIPIEAGLPRWAWRYANGHTLWVPYGAQVPYKLRVLNGLARLQADGYVDPNNLWCAGFSRGGLLAAHYAAFDSRVRGACYFHPVTKLNLLSPWFDNHPNPEACAVEDAELLAPQLAGRPAYLTVNSWDTTVNTDAAIGFARALTAASGPTSSYVPDVTLKVQNVAGHTSPNSVYEEAEAWLTARTA